MRESQESPVRSLGWEESLERENGNPLQYTCLENPMDRGAWWATVYGVTKSRTGLSTHNNNALCASSNDSQCFLFGTGLSCGMWDLVS